MTPDQHIAFPISKDGLLIALRVAIALLPEYGAPAWKEMPDGCQLDVSFVKGYLLRLKRNIENEIPNSDFTEPARYPDE